MQVNWWIVARVSSCLVLPTESGWMADGVEARLSSRY